MGQRAQDFADRCATGVDLSDPKCRELDSVQKHLLVDPSDYQALARAGTLLYEMGRFKESAAHLARAMSSPKCLMCRNRPDAAGKAVADDTLQQDMTDVHCNILLELADRHAASSDTQLAERHYRAAGALSPTRPEPYLGLGAMALQGGQFEHAREFFETARDIQPRCAEAYGGLAIVHQHRRDYAAAFEMHLKCLELDTDNLVALLGLFQTSCEMGTFSKIIHYLEVYLMRNPGDTSVLFCLATLYAREGRLYEARRVTLEIIEREPDKEGAAELLGKLDDALSGIDN